MVQPNRHTSEAVKESEYTKNWQNLNSLTSELLGTNTEVVLNNFRIPLIEDGAISVGKIDLLSHDPTKVEGVLSIGQTADSLNFDIQAKGLGNLAPPVSPVHRFIAKDPSDLTKRFTGFELSLAVNGTVSMFGITTGGEFVVLQTDEDRDDGQYPAVFQFGLACVLAAKKARVV